MDNLGYPSKSIVAGYPWPFMETYGCHFTIPKDARKNWPGTSPGLVLWGEDPGRLFPRTLFTELQKYDEDEEFRTQRLKTFPTRREYEASLRNKAAEKIAAKVGKAPGTF